MVIELIEKLTIKSKPLTPPNYWQSVPMYTHLLLHAHPPPKHPFHPSSPLLTIRPLTKPNFKNQFIPNSGAHLCFRYKRHRKLRPLIQCAAGSDDVGGTKKWEKWVPRNFLVADKVFKWISEATSSPIVQYISSPTTFLHYVDPRIKLVCKFFCFLPNIWFLSIVVELSYFY